MRNTADNATSNDQPITVKRSRAWTRPPLRRYVDICADCNLPFEYTGWRRHSRRCRPCKWAKNAATLKNWGLARPLAKIAHSLVAKAVLRGDLPEVRTLRCVDCGSRAESYDHRDYTKPLEVAPVCQSCNAKRGAAYPYNQ